LSEPSTRLRLKSGFEARTSGAVFFGFTESNIILATQNIDK